MTIVIVHKLIYSDYGDDAERMMTRVMRNLLIHNNYYAADVI